MTRRLISIEVNGPIFAMRGWKAHGLALGAGLRPTYNGVAGAWVADAKRLPDLLAYCQRRNISVDVANLAGVTSVTPAPGTTRESCDSRVVPPSPDPQFSLFDGGDAA